MWRALALVGVLVIGAVVLALAGDHRVVFAIGFMTAAVAAVLLVALFFYAVGDSEDRDRASGRNGGPPQTRGNGPPTPRS